MSAASEDSSTSQPAGEALTPTQLAHAIADLILDKKGERMAVLDVSGSQTRIAEHMVLCSGTNARQVGAIAEEVGRLSKELDRLPLAISGKDHGWWVCIDLGDVVVHVMQPEARRHYDLERLWADAPIVRKGPDYDLDLDGESADGPEAPQV